MFAKKKKPRFLYVLHVWLVWVPPNGTMSYPSSLPNDDPS